MLEKKRAWLYYHGASPEQDSTQRKPWTADLIEYAERMECEIVGITYGMSNDARSRHSRLEFFTRAAEDGIMDVLLLNDCSEIDADTEKVFEFIRYLNEQGVKVVSMNKKS